MLLKWLDAREATEVGNSLADDFVLQTGTRSSGTGRRNGPAGHGKDVQKFLQTFLQRVDREARPLRLNVFKRAKLANSFKWRLLEKGVEREIADELTQALVLRISGGADGASMSGTAASALSQRPGKVKTKTLHTDADALLAKGAYTDALEVYQQIVSLDSRDAMARHRLGIALAQLARYGEAGSEFRRAIAIRSNFPEAHFHLAGILLTTGRPYEAETPLRRALKLRPSYVDARVLLGQTFALTSRLGDARDCFEKALRIAPRHVQALFWTGQVEMLSGHFAEAEAMYRRALEVDPAAPYAWAALAWLRKMTPSDGAWVKRAEQLAESGLGSVDESPLRFAIGKYYDDIRDFPRAFRSYRRANELHKRRAQPYNRQEHIHFVDDMLRVYTAEALAGARAGGSDSARPVFVVGMPRSGTSLVEQIIASHPAAAGAGELNSWTAIVMRQESTIRRELLAESQRKKLAAEYLRVLDTHSSAAQRVVDKAPANTDYLGLIHSAFPNARIIYLQRDPIDTCLSCYFQQLQPALNFTMDLEDLAHYYRQHRRLMAHWRTVLPADRLLEVPYEELVTEQESWTRKILEFLGLPWDARTLEFHETTRAVTTASAWQVRQKIYKTSVERWRNYEKFIGPLLELRDLAS
jgi:tetratricopeptide (TPR) repeat protein